MFAVVSHHVDTADASLLYEYLLTVCKFKLKLNYFRIMYTLLFIAATLPLTTSSAQRTFSTLKRVKTYLRSTMSCERLTGLALLNTHRDITITADAVTGHFAKANRRLDFVLDSLCL